MEEKTATQTSPFANIRRTHVMQLTAALFREIEPALNEDQHREVHRLLFEALSLNGVMLMTEKDRADLGLEPRDQMGWTSSERLQFEDAHREALKAMIAPLVQRKE